VSKINLYSLTILTSLLITSCATGPRLTDDPRYAHISTVNPKSDYFVGQTWRGIASYYGKEHHGNRTASGEVFDMDKVSAAHRYLPFGAVVRVVNLKNNRSIETKVNDRGPFIRGRILDVSLEAARELGMVRDGLVEVQITIIDLPDRK
jgi:rare lipoprotein A